MEHTPEESATRILNILRERNVSAGEVGMIGWFLNPFSVDEWSIADFDAGVNFAAASGWLTVEGPMLRLTDLGEANANRT